MAVRCQTNQLFSGVVLKFKHFFWVVKVTTGNPSNWGNGNEIFMTFVVLDSEENSEILEIVITL